MQAAPAASEGAPASIVEFVASARRRRQARSLLEAAALGLGAAGVGVAACLQSAAAGAPSAATMIACGSLSGLAAAATWWVERAKLDDRRLAQRLDARLSQGGALSSAYQARASHAPGALVELLEQRVLAGLGRQSLADALPRAGWIWLAPPALGAALVALVLELPARESSRAFPSAGAAASASAQPVLGRAQAVLDGARALAEGAGEPLLREGELAEIDAALRELDELGGSAADPGAARTSLVDQLLAVRNELGSRTPADPPRGIPEAVDRAGGAGVAEGGNSLLKNGAAERTMSGSNRSTAADGEPGRDPSTPERGAAGEAGTLAGRWWPERHDPVVQGWRRALATRPSQR